MGALRLQRLGRAEVLVPLGVTLLAAVIRGWDLGHPDGLVWDEVYYGVDAGDPLDSQIEMDAVHPPVGTKLLAVGVALLGDDAMGRRIVPWLAGTVVVLLSYFLARRLLGSVWWAGLVALFVALDGLQIVHSRTAVLAFFPHLEAQDESPGRLAPASILCGVLVGLAISTKWVAALALVGMAVLTVLAARPSDRRGALRVSAITFVGIPMVIYVLSYSVTWFSGDTTPVEWVQRQLDIMKFHRELSDPHDFASHPIGWPLMIRPVPYFWAVRPDGREFQILAVGNPALWWSFVVALPALLVVWWRERNWTVEVVLAALVILWVPWLLVLRPQIFFYYLTPLVPFMALGIVWCLRELTTRWRYGGAFAVAYTALVVASAAVFMPLWLGLWVSAEHLDRLLLFESWRFPGTG
jgi:dolichyl-phosphate-mannose--protein O-mannosyl transferase